MVHPTIQAMKKIRPGARLGIAVAIAGDVNLIPSRNRDWNRVTLFFFSNKEPKKAVKM